MVDELELKTIRKRWCNVLDQIARIRATLDSGRILRTNKLEYKLHELEREEQELRFKLENLEKEYSKDVQASIRRKANGKPITSRTNVFGTWGQIR